MSLFNLFKKKTRIEEEIPNQIPEIELSIVELKKHFEEYKKEIRSILLKFKSTMNLDTFNFDNVEINQVEAFYLKHTKNSGDLNYSQKEFDLAYDTYVAHAIMWNIGGELILDTMKGTQSSGKICLHNFTGKSSINITRPISDYHELSIDPDDDEKMGDFIFRQLNVYLRNPDEFNINPIRNFNF